jgi:hypothetical protein
MDDKCYCFEGSFRRNAKFYFWATSPEDARKRARERPSSADHVEDEMGGMDDIEIGPEIISIEGGDE